MHHPELLEAIVKGYNIDTSDFIINTAHNSRSREGNYNHWKTFIIIIKLYTWLKYKPFNLDKRKNYYYKIK